MLRAKLQNVSLTYDEGASWALEDINLEVAQGERLCVLGSNGSGKSTLAKVLAGLEAPDKGEVELADALVFDGKGANAKSYRQARHHMGFVFQNPEDQIVTSIAEDDVAFGPENLTVKPKEIAERVDEELERVALESYRHEDPAHFSGGMLQRLALAGALAKHGDLLILDEPGAMLDVRGRRGIMRVLDELHGDGATIVHITHFMDEALRADRVVVMKAGRIILEGTPQEVFAHKRELEAAGLEAPHAANTELRYAQPIQAAPDIVVSNVVYAYSEVQVLNNISFEVAHGSVTALIGHTGSGKSTLARLICALDKPKRGAISVCGINTANKKRRRELRGTIGYVMQMPERQLFAETVYDDIAFGPRNLHLSETEVKTRVTEQLNFFNLIALRDKSPFELSGGQQRSVALAGVLAMEPKVLVLDEPTAGLDPAGAQRIKRLIKKLQDRGTTILMITHSMENVAELADNVVVLNAGSIALTGAPSEVFAQAEILHAIGLGAPANIATPAKEECHD